MKFFVMLLLINLCFACTNHQSQTSLSESNKNPAQKAAEIKNRNLFPSGEISAADLKKNHPEFFHSGHFKFNSQDIEKLASYNQPITIVTYFGLWCHDSQREVPRLLSLLSKVKNPNLSHQLIALDVYKQEPQNRQERDAIKYTPTFIIKSSGAEIARIVEKPQQNLAKDLVKILKL